MKVLEVRNVAEALPKGIELLKQYGEHQDSRAGPVLVMPSPVTTVYEHPWERVLTCPVRRANVWFHLFESLWMLDGRNDATWLDHFVSDFSSRFAEDNGLQHGAYGFRWRNHFDMEGGGSPALPDQLATIIKLLKANSGDRRVVLQMWDPVADLDVNVRDVPCNTQAYFRVVGGRLEMTVCNRSNDIIWGAYGANAFHFSVLQEYVAAAIGVPMGRYYQISNNYHAYESVLDRFSDNLDDGYKYRHNMSTTMMVSDADSFLPELNQFLAAPDDVPLNEYKNTWFRDVGHPMWDLWNNRRDPTWDQCLELVQCDSLRSGAKAWKR